jgi:hypothetical protein
MRRYCLVFGLLLVSLVSAQAGHTPPKIFLRVHVQTTGEGQSALETTTVTIQPSGEPVLIRALPEVSEVNLIGVQQDANVLRLKFDHPGQVALDAVTAQNQGRLLIVMINGQVIYSPTIDTEITSGELDIPHPIPAVVVQLLQDVAAKNLRQANRT